MVVLYAPNDDDPSFFLNFFDHFNDFKCDEVIIGEDFNLVLDLDIDKKAVSLKHIQNQWKHWKISAENRVSFVP